MEGAKVWSTICGPGEIQGGGAAFMDRSGGCLTVVREMDFSALASASLDDMAAMLEAMVVPALTYQVVTPTSASRYVFEQSGEVVDTTAEFEPEDVYEEEEDGFCFLNLFCKEDREVARERFSGGWPTIEELVLGAAGLRFASDEHLAKLAVEYRHGALHLCSVPRVVANVWRTAAEAVRVVRDTLAAGGCVDAVLSLRLGGVPPHDGVGFTSYSQKLEMLAVSVEQLSKCDPEVVHSHVGDQSCWVYVMEKLLGTGVCSGYSDLVAFLTSPGFRQAALSRGDPEVWFWRDSVQAVHVALVGSGDYGSAGPLRKLPVLSLVKEVVDEDVMCFSHWGRALGFPPVPDGKARCGRCGFLVVLEGHFERCRVPSPPVGSKPERIAAAWVGDGQHTVDVRRVLLEADGCGDLGRTRESIKEYVDGDRQGWWYKAAVAAGLVELKGVTTAEFHALSRRELSTLFEANYERGLRDVYVASLRAYKGLDPRDPRLIGLFAIPGDNAGAADLRVSVAPSVDPFASPGSTRRARFALPIVEDDVEDSGDDGYESAPEEVVRVEIPSVVGEPAVAVDPGSSSVKKKKKSVGFAAQAVEVREIPAEGQGKRLVRESERKRRDTYTRAGSPTPRKVEDGVVTPGDEAADREEAAVTTVRVAARGVASARVRGLVVHKGEYFTDVSASFLDEHYRGVPDGFGPKIPGLLASLVNMQEDPWRLKFMVPRVVVGSGDVHCFVCLSAGCEQGRYNRVEDYVEHLRSHRFDVVEKCGAGDDDPTAAVVVTVDTRWAGSVGLAAFQGVKPTTVSERGSF